ncbi:MAG TPA: ABC transporter permease [Thermoanaerobaculia bacterium]|nr:ABC transporter permease [Thermoanaerobaculia bacterium]
MLRQLRYAWRVLAWRPVFSLSVVAILGLGVGLDTAIFNFIDAMLVRPLPYLDGDRLVALHGARETAGTDWEPISVADYRDWRDQNGVFTAVGALARRSFNVSTEEEPERVEGCEVSANLFAMLGVAPLLGRGFRPEEEEPHRAAVALLGHELWQRRFRGDPRVVGKTLRLDGRLFEVVGVMPERFAFPEFAQLWKPLALGGEPGRRDARSLGGLARLAPGVTLGQAQRAMDGVARRLAAQYPATNARWGARVRPLRAEMMPAGPRIGMYMMLAAVVCVLLIIAANVATLMLTLAAGRATESAVRAALGASRGSLVRQSLCESLLLAGAAAVVGVAVSGSLVRLMVSTVPVAIPYWIHFELDARIVLFGVLAALLSTAVFGLAPALWAARRDAFAALRAGGVGSPGAGGSRLQRALVVGEFALSVVVLIGAMLMAKSFVHLQSAPRGYRSAGLLTVRLSLSSDEYRDPARRRVFFHDLQQRVAALPGVRGAGLAESLPISHDGYAEVSLAARDRTLPRGTEPVAVHHAATAGYLRTIGIPIVQGRDFTREEADGAQPLVLVSESLARRLWPGAEPLGRELRCVGGGAAAATPWLRVIGVTGNVDRSFHLAGLDAIPPAQIYLPYPLSLSPNMTLVVAASGPPGELAPAIRAQVRAAGAGVPVFHLLTMDEVIGRELWLPRLWGEWFTVFGALALAIAALGVYGVTAFAVAQRQREIGIRMALGAGRARLLAMITAQGARLALLGVGIGVAVALPAMRSLSALLYGVSPADPLIFGGVPLLLLAASLLATYLPARRASDLDPSRVLRA